MALASDTKNRAETRAETREEVWDNGYDKGKQYGRDMQELKDKIFSMRKNLYELREGCQYLCRVANNKLIWQDEVYIILTRVLQASDCMNKIHDEYKERAERDYKEPPLAKVTGTND